MEKTQTRRLLITPGQVVGHGLKLVGLSGLMAGGLTIGIGGLMAWTAGVIITWKEITSGHFADTMTCLTILGVSLLALCRGLVARKQRDKEETVEYVTRENLSHIPLEETLVRPVAPTVEAQTHLLRATAQKPDTELS